MWHSDIALTMNTYTDENLLQTANAVELLPNLPIDGLRTVTSLVTCAGVKTSVTESISDNLGGLRRPARKRENPKKPSGFQGFVESGRLAPHHG